MRDFTTIFCDDIRQEDNGKHILIGVYSGDLVPGVLPQNIPLAIWLRITPPPYGPHHFKLSLHVDGGSESGIEGDFDVPSGVDMNSLVLAFNAIPVQLHAPGRVVAKLSLNSGAPVEIGALQIRPVAAGRKTNE